MAHGWLQGAGLGAMMCASGGNTSIKPLSERTMTQQQLLQAARNVLTTTQTDTGRPALRKAALAAGRSQDQVRKASTMRLALWVSKGTSAI